MNAHATMEDRYAAMLRASVPPKVSGGTGRPRTRSNSVLAVLTRPMTIEEIRDRVPHAVSHASLSEMLRNLRREGLVRRAGRGSNGKPGGCVAIWERT